jgi:hypothetical protein
MGIMEFFFITAAYILYIKFLILCPGGLFPV